MGGLTAPHPSHTFASLLHTFAANKDAMFVAVCYNNILTIVVLGVTASYCISEENAFLSMCTSFIKNCYKFDFQMKSISSSSTDIRMVNIQLKHYLLT